MSQVISPRWKSKQDKDSKLVESVLREAFPGADAYRYNSASVRVRVIDPRFAGMTVEARDSLVEPYIHRLPVAIQSDIMFLLTLAPGEEATPRGSLLNLEFEDPGPNLL